MLFIKNKWENAWETWHILSNRSEWKMPWAIKEISQET